MFKLSLSNANSGRSIGQEAAGNYKEIAVDLIKK